MATAPVLRAGPRVVHLEGAVIVEGAMTDLLLRARAPFPSWRDDRRSGRCT